MSEIRAPYSVPAKDDGRLTVEIAADWERRLLEKARLLRQGGKSAILTVMWDGQSILFWDGNPSGKMIVK